MQCPQCEAPRRGTHTRKPAEHGHAFMVTLSSDWPELVCRRRQCRECAHRWSTVEIVQDDLQLMMADIARQAAQLVVRT